MENFSSEHGHDDSSHPSVQDFIELVGDALSGARAADGGAVVGNAGAGAQ